MKKRLAPAMVVAMKKGRVLSLFALALCVTAAVTAGTASPTEAARAVKQSCRVPAVVGKTLVVAKARIRKAHCRVGTVRYVRSTARQKNRVVSQRPKRGRKLKRGARVNFTVGRGPAAVSNPSAPSANASFTSFTSCNASLVAPSKGLERPAGSLGELADAPRPRDANSATAADCERTAVEPQRRGRGRPA